MIDLSPKGNGSGTTAAEWDITLVVSNMHPCPFLRKPATPRQVQWLISSIPLYTGLAWVFKPSPNGRFMALGYMKNKRFQ
jgi:hypothetical protein